MTPVWLWETAAPLSPHPPGPWRCDGAGMGRGPAAPGTTPLNMWSFGSTVFSPSRGLRNLVPSLRGLPGSGGGPETGIVHGQAPQHTAALGGAGTGAALALPGSAPAPGEEKSPPRVYRGLGAGSGAAQRCVLGRLRCLCRGIGTFHSKPMFSTLFDSVLQ